MKVLEQLNPVEPNGLRLLRARVRVSQLRVALTAGIHPTRLWRIENGLVEPTSAERAGTGDVLRRHGGGDLAGDEHHVIARNGRARSHLRGGRAVSYLMPFGKHKGSLLRDLPDDYLAWLSGRDLRNPLRQLVEEEVRLRATPVRACGALTRLTTHEQTDGYAVTWDDELDGGFAKAMRTAEGG